MDKIKILSLKFTLLQFFYLLAQASIFSYASALFTSRGVENGYVGTMCSVETFCSFIGFIVIGIICNTSKKVKLPLIISLIITIIVYVLLFYFTTNPIAIVLFGIIGFIYDPFYALSDGWILNKTNNSISSFAKVRTVSIFVYSLFFILFSFLISKYSYNVCLITVIVTLTIAIIIAFTIPEMDKDVNVKEIKNNLKFKDLISYEFKNMGLLLITLLFIGFCSTSLLTLVPMILGEINGDIFFQGVGLFICYTANSVFTYVSQRIKNLNIYIKLISSVIVMLIGLILLMFLPLVGIILFACCMRGISDAFATVAMREYVNGFIDEKYKTFSHSICSAFYGSLGGTIGIFISTHLYADFGIKGFVLFSCITGIIAVSLTIILSIVLKKRHLSTNVLIKQ